MHCPLARYVPSKQAELQVELYRTCPDKQDVQFMLEVTQVLQVGEQLTHSLPDWKYPSEQVTTHVRTEEELIG